MKSETGKLPKGFSYPLKPTALEAALTSAGIIIDTHLVRRHGNLFDANFWPPNENIPYERLYVRAGSTASERHAEARIEAETVMLPALVRWIADILARDANSPIRRDHQSLNLVSGKMTHGKARHIRVD